MYCRSFIIDSNLMVTNRRPSRSVQEAIRFWLENCKQLDPKRDGWCKSILFCEDGLYVAWCDGLMHHRPYAIIENGGELEKVDWHDYNALYLELMNKYEKDVVVFNHKTIVHTVPKSTLDQLPNGINIGGFTAIKPLPGDDSHPSLGKGSVAGLFPSQKETDLIPTSKLKNFVKKWKNRNKKSNFHSQKKKK